MPSLETTAERIAQVMVAGPFALPMITHRVRSALGRCPRWLSPVLRELVAEFGEGSRPRLAALRRRLLTAPGLWEAHASGRLEFREPAPDPVMCPARGAAESWDVPPICTRGELAAWLNLTPGELEWFADVRLMNSRATGSRLSHYRYRWISKRDCGVRLLEAPKLRLKLLQKRLLHDLIGRIPPHEAAHGFRRGRSIRTFVDLHVGRAVVLRLDLRDFFSSVTRARVLALFLAAGYPEPVAARLAGICTAVVPREVVERSPEPSDPPARWSSLRRYRLPHLPQGAPTSPALANLAAHGLDCRLAGLARSVGAHYSRYADDLVFSGDIDVARQAERLAIQVGAIVLEEGFEVNWRKMRLMRQGVSQRAAGMVLNEHANVPRRDFDALKAILHNCARWGPESQNRTGHPDFRGHLMGRIAHVTHVNPRRGTRLRSLFDRIQWPAC